MKYFLIALLSSIAFMLIISNPYNEFVRIISIIIYFTIIGRISSIADKIIKYEDYRKENERGKNEK